MNTHQQVKTIGANGQLSLGKEFAGKMVLVDQIIYELSFLLSQAEQLLKQEKKTPKIIQSSCARSRMHCKRKGSQTL